MGQSLKMNSKMSTKWRVDAENYDVMWRDGSWSKVVVMFYVKSALLVINSFPADMMPDIITDLRLLD